MKTFSCSTLPVEIAQSFGHRADFAVAHETIVELGDGGEFAHGAGAKHFVGATILPLLTFKKRQQGRLVIESNPRRLAVRSEVGGKLQLRVNAEQRTGRWRSRTEIADETVPGADLDVTGSVVGAVHEDRTDRRGERIFHR